MLLLNAKIAIFSLIFVSDMRKIIFLLALLLGCGQAFAQNIEVECSLLDAVADYDAGNIDAAERALIRLHAADSTNDAVLYYLAMCEASKKYYEAATTHLQEAIALDSTNTWYRGSLAEIYLERKSYSAAVPLLEQLLSEEPGSYNNPYILSLIADDHMQKGGLEKALDYYNRALAMDDTYIPALYGRMLVFDYQKNYPAYFSALTSMMGNSEIPTELKIHNVKDIMDNMDAPFYWVWGEQIKVLVDTLVTLYPKEYGAHELKTRLDYIRGDKESAAEECLKMADIAADSGDRRKAAEALASYADLQYTQGKEKEAFKAYSSAIKLAPDYLPPLNNYAYYLSLKKKTLKKALEMSARTIEKEPDNATYLDTYGWILHLLGRDEEAKPIFKHALIYGGRDNKEVLRHYSEVLRALGDIERADYYLQLSEQKKDK